MRTTRHFLLATLTTGAIGLAGCQFFGTDIQPDKGQPMPESLAQGEVLDIQVYRNVTKLELTNTTARSFAAGTLWVNERWSQPVEALEPGESLTLDLKQFYDEFGEPFRAGGFFATRDPDRVVLAQLETGGTLYGLIVTENYIK